MAGRCVGCSRCGGGCGASRGAPRRPIRPRRCARSSRSRARSSRSESVRGAGDPVDEADPGRAPAVRARAGARAGSTSCAASNGVNEKGAEMGFLDKAKAAAEQAATKAKETAGDLQTKRELGQAYDELGPQDVRADRGRRGVLAGARSDRGADPRAEGAAREGRRREPPRRDGRAETPRRRRSSGARGLIPRSSDSAAFPLRGEAPDRPDLRSVQSAAHAARRTDKTGDLHAPNGPARSELRIVVGARPQGELRRTTAEVD